ncbi:D-alanine--D-alanine ligase [Anaerovibrio sp.]|uniref:D-alanine--D-alanine ligase family protein n=1 Tax=Anaerovibrio sp. TaxID=1872532 RepID=UPI00388F4CBE
MSKKIVVVMGGPSSEGEVSRRSGTAILNALKSKNYNAVGLELVPETFVDEIREMKADFVFNALHGKFGEDGIIQGTLEMLGIPYTSSGVCAAAVTMDKVATKRFFLAGDVPTPRSHTYFRFEHKQRDLAEEIQKEFSIPVVVKAAAQGSSIGVVIVKDAKDLKDALNEAFKYDNAVLVEEYIKGRELTVAVYGNEEKQEVLPIIEITTSEGWYDYVNKYKVGASQHIIPAPISDELTKEIHNIAKRAFAVCGCCGVARVDFMLSEDNKPYAIEVNTVPGMTETSLVPDAGRAAGIEFPELCQKILYMAGFED